MSQPLTAPAPYRPGHARATAAAVALAAIIFFDVVGIANNSYQLATGNVTDPTSEEITLYDLFDFALGLVRLLVIITTVVLFCLWLYRAASNLRALGNPPHTLDYSPGWAVGSFFVPIVNLVAPYRATKEVWLKSDPAAAEPDAFGSYYVPKAPAVLPLWWATWLISNVADNVATRLYFKADSLAEMTTAIWADLCGDVFSIPAAALAILVVRGIDRRQSERSRRINYVPNLPPPPPVFHPPAGSLRPTPTATVPTTPPAAPPAGED